MIFLGKSFSSGYDIMNMNKKVKMEVPSHENNPEYVLMPWDDMKTIIVDEGTHLAKSYSRWELIQKQLKTAVISDVKDFIEVIRSYNVVFEKNGDQTIPNWKCLVLHQYFSQLDENERNRFFEENGILSTIRNLALQLKELVPRLRILKTGCNSSVELHQLQVASLLSHAFFCTFPKRKADVPSINFITLYEGDYGPVLKYYVEKVKCLMHYFKRIHMKREYCFGAVDNKSSVKEVISKQYNSFIEPSGNLSFHRLCIPDHKFPRWDKTTARLCSLKVDAERKIEDQDGYLQMDFANQYVGGGVLGRGCVQEEIRFLISPELIVSRLFTECLADNEALFVVGSERFCNYTGYSKTFAFDGDYVDTTPFDENRRRKSYLIVLDALYFHHSSDQYRESKILRELKKAYVGFKSQQDFKTLPLATGNWGCGAFRGDPQMKTLLQLMASSQACRDVLYLTFGNYELKKQIEEFYSALEKKAVNVGMLYRIIRNYNKGRKKNQTVFEFVIEALNQMEEKKFTPKSTPSTSKDIRTAFETAFSVEPSKTKQNCQKSIEETPSENYPEMDLDFEALDEEVQQISKNNPLNKDQSSSQQVQREHSSILDSIWYENERECNQSSKSSKESTDGAKEHSMLRENSPSLFSDDEMEIVCESNENLNDLSKSNECATPKSIKKTENEGVRRTSCKKVIQPKIINYFRK